jgi:hypothetical protein
MTSLEGVLVACRSRVGSLWRRRADRSTSPCARCHPEFDNRSCVVGCAARRGFSAGKRRPPSISPPEHRGSRSPLWWRTAPITRRASTRGGPRCVRFRAGRTASPISSDSCWTSDICADRHRSARLTHPTSGRGPAVPASGLKLPTQAWRAMTSDDVSLFDARTSRSFRNDLKPLTAGEDLSAIATLPITDPRPAALLRLVADRGGVRRQAGAGPAPARKPRRRWTPTGTYFRTRTMRCGSSSARCTRRGRRPTGSWS